MIASICILFIFSPIIFAKEDPGVTIPLVRHKTPREVGINIRGIKEFSTNWMKPNYFDGPNGTNDSVAIYRYLDNEFYGIIQIGKKARPFNLAIDTAWGHTWVMSEDCAYTTIGCWFHNKYDHTKSSSYIENGTQINIPLGDYNLTGYLSVDTFHLEQLNVTNQTFIEMVKVPKLYILNKADGVLGLGFPSLSNGLNPIFYNLYKQGKIKKALFSIYLNRDRSSNRGGNLILGRIEKRHILKGHNITYLPVIRTGYWQFRMDRVEVNNGKKTFPFCSNGCSAYADTSTNVIRGPRNDIDKINRLIGAKYVMPDRYEISCDRINILPEITFIIGGNEFLLHGRDYVKQMSYKSFTLCLSAFSVAKEDTANVWALGGAFLTEYYSIYNVAENIIGFVKAA